MIFVGMVPDPRKMVQESENRIQDLEKLALEIVPTNISIYIYFSHKYILYKNIRYILYMNYINYIYYYCYYYIYNIYYLNIYIGIYLFKYIFNKFNLFKINIYKYFVLHIFFN